MGGGFFRHTDRFLTGTYSTTEGAYTAGLGMRTWVNERVFVAGDARIGWEAHFRLAATVGIALRYGAAAPRYSSRIAATGSTRMARQAGTRLPAKPIDTASAAATA